MKINYLKTKILAKIGSLPLIGLLLSNKALALTDPGQENINIRSVGDVVGKFEIIVNWVQYIFFIVAALYIILAAFAYLTSGGDETKIKTAKDRLMYAVIAIVVALLAFVMKNVVTGFLND